MMRIQANESGFSLLQLVVTLAIISVVSTLAVMAVTRARVSMRLSNSTRQFGAYVERARADAVRRHGSATVQMITNSTYSVTMDFNAAGSVTTQTFPLESNVTFITSLQTITFDWRGRIVDEMSVGFGNESGTANVNITGSGDVTIDSEIFHDASIPQVTYNTNVSGDVIPDILPSPSPTSTSGATPSPSPTVSPVSDPNATPTPTPTPTPHPGNNPTPTPTPTPQATPTPSPSPGGTPTPSLCSIVATPGSLTIMQNGSGNIVVALNNFSGTATIKATSSNSGQIQVSPLSKKVTGSALATFTVTVKRASGSVTFSSSCGSQSVNINVP